MALFDTILSVKIVFSCTNKGHPPTHPPREALWAKLPQTKLTHPPTGHRPPPPPCGVGLPLSKGLAPPPPACLHSSNAQHMPAPTHHQKANLLFRRQGIFIAVTEGAEDRIIVFMAGVLAGHQPTRKRNKTKRRTNAKSEPPSHPPQRPCAAQQTVAFVRRRLSLFLRFGLGAGCLCSSLFIMVIMTTTTTTRTPPPLPLPLPPTTTWDADWKSDQMRTLPLEALCTQQEVWRAVCAAMEAAPSAPFQQLLLQGTLQAPTPICVK